VAVFGVPTGPTPQPLGPGFAPSSPPSPPSYGPPPAQNEGNQPGGSTNTPGDPFTQLELELCAARTLLNGVTGIIDGHITSTLDDCQQCVDRCHSSICGMANSVCDDCDATLERLLGKVDQSIIMGFLALYGLLQRFGVYPPEYPPSQGGVDVPPAPPTYPAAPVPVMMPPPPYLPPPLGPAPAPPSMPPVPGSPAPPPPVVPGDWWGLAVALLRCVCRSAGIGDDGQPLPPPTKSVTWIQQPDSVLTEIPSEE